MGYIMSKQLLGHTANVSLVEIDGKLHASIELILLTMEPHYEKDPDGDVVKSRPIEDVRIMASPKSLREFAQTLLAVAGDAESFENRATLAEK